MTHTSRAHPFVPSLLLALLSIGGISACSGASAAADASDGTADTLDALSANQGTGGHLSEATATGAQETSAETEEPATAPYTNDESGLRRAVQDAMGEDTEAQEHATTWLRQRGPDALAQLLAAGRELGRRLLLDPTRAAEPATARWRNAVDAVSAQRDGFASGLYWYTELDAAKRAATQQGRPILSLRLLGRLDEELSCANSRFFRSLLYANQEVARFLSQNFVLHWSSERPAPVVRVDMGDGRTLVRTVSGNSAHYVLDAQGRIADVLPGLFTPSEFTRLLERGQQIASRCGAADSWSMCISEAHRHAQTDALHRWGEIAADIPPRIRPRYDQLSLGGPFTQDAIDINQLTIGKALSEQDLLEFARARQGLPAPNPGTPWWMRFSPQLPTELDERSLALVRLKAGPDFVRQVDSIRFATSQDSLRNEYVMHRDVHRYFANASESAQRFEVFNEWLYATVFRTPQSDEWMGLVDASVYQALEFDR